jgi:hypothetical protein
LTSDEAIVLFEWLMRSHERFADMVDDQAEQIALWNVTCLLESQLVEPFVHNYAQLVEQARERLRHH